MNWTNQSAVHAQREQPGLSAVQVNPKKKVFDRLVVRAVSTQIRPTKHRVLTGLQAAHGHRFSFILTMKKEKKKVKTLRSLLPH